jgi:hypothetical protein
MSTKKRKAKSQKATADSRKGSTCRVSSRRRSLSALAKVLIFVAEGYSEARRQIWRKDRSPIEERDFNYQRYHGKCDALIEVHREIVNMMSEEPKGNNQALPEGGAQPH